MTFKDGEFVETTTTMASTNGLLEQDKADMANLGKHQRFNVRLPVE